jgi:hypothetical protein
LFRPSREYCESVKFTAVDVPMARMLSNKTKKIPYMSPEAFDCAFKRGPL